ncbi:hypothetical protein EON76_04955 [bacterium]|nr:MAG: hypothetical protein EON76_04955 [bacterium]
MMWIWIGACAAIIGVAVAFPGRGWYKMYAAGAQKSWNKPLFPLPPSDDDQGDEVEDEPVTLPPQR